MDYIELKVQVWAIMAERSHNEGTKTPEQVGWSMTYDNKTSPEEFCLAIWDEGCERAKAGETVSVRVSEISPCVWADKVADFARFDRLGPD